MLITSLRQKEHFFGSFQPFLFDLGGSLFCLYKLEAMYTYWCLFIITVESEHGYLVGYLENPKFIFIA